MSEAGQEKIHENFEGLKEKSAARVVLMDESGRVATIYVRKHGYYKIPGGGVETGENIEDAAKREVLEEAGADCEIVHDLGDAVTTVLPGWDLRDISYGFIAKMIGKQNDTEFEEWEKERGFELIWMDNLDVAIDTFEKNEVSDTDQKALQERDLGFLKTARKNNIA